MKYEVPLLSNKQIADMDDNQLYQEIKTYKRLIYKLRKNQQETRVAEEEISYLQAEAQNRGFNT